MYNANDYRTIGNFVDASQPIDLIGMAIRPWISKIRTRRLTSK